MRDLTQAQTLDIDTSDMVIVTHPDKKARYGNAPAEFVMTRLSYVKRGLEAGGYKIIGDADTSVKPTSREQALLDEVEQLRRQLADGASSESADGDREALQRQAEALGITYDKRWGAKKLQAAIDDAKTALAADDFDEDDDTE